MTTRFMEAALLSAVLFLSLATMSAQNTTTAAEIAKVDIDSARRVHVVDSSGHEASPPASKGQVSCSSAKIADDKHTAGWLAEYENPNNSYPLPLALVIFRNGAIVREIGIGQSIWDWKFAKAGSEVAFWTGPTHGDFVPHFELRDVRTGRLLAQWDGHLDQKHPGWIDGLKEE